MGLSIALYIVPTPIGNLGDISQRAIDVLNQVSVIACEDTRHSGKLLNHLAIKTRKVSLHDHNEREKTRWLVEQLDNGSSIALISDAGTPLISDPGYHLVSQVRSAGFKVVPLPGPCAAITALSASGLPSDRFCFEGFLPAKESGRIARLTELAKAPFTLIFYESPHRIIASLTTIAKVLGADRQVVIGREISKTFETFLSAPAEELLEIVKNDPQQQKGEFVLMCRGYQRDPDPDEIPDVAVETLRLLTDELPLKKAAALTAKIHGLKKNALYKYGLENG